MYKLTMTVGKTIDILYKNHLFFQWHRKKKKHQTQNIQNAPQKAVLSLFFWQDTESAKTKSVNSVLWRGKIKGNKASGSSGDKTHLSADRKKDIYALFIPLQVQI